MKRFMTLVAILAVSIVLAVQPAAAATNFPDVPKTDRFHDEIQYLVGKNIISGYTNGKFQPKSNVTRGEAAIMIGRMMKLDGTKRDTKFKDVSKSNGASGYIAAASDKGIISGHVDGTFRPNQKISRGDMAIVLSRSFGIMLGSANQYKDVGLKMNAREAISNLSGAHITSGYPDGTFRPNAQVTREQFSAFLARGMSPVFQQRTMKKDGYAYDLTKTYVYSQSNGDLQASYEKVNQVFGVDRYEGYMWVYKHSGTGTVEYLTQEETAMGLYTGFPLSESYLDMDYPVKLNEKWQPGMDQLERKSYTGMNKTVKTSYKTFTNAVEITDNDGMRHYFVKGIGVVKVLDKSGKTVTELKSIQ